MRPLILPFAGLLLLGAQAAPCVKCKPDDCLNAVRASGSAEQCSPFLISTVTLPTVTHTISEDIAITASVYSTASDFITSTESVVATSSAFETQSSLTTVVDVESTTEVTIVVVTQTDTITSTSTDTQTFYETSTVVADIATITSSSESLTSATSSSESLTFSTSSSEDLTFTTSSSTAIAISLVPRLAATTTVQTSSSQSLTYSLALPTFASQCADEAAFLSACRCAGFKTGVITAPAPTITVTVTGTALVPEATQTLLSTIYSTATVQVTSYSIVSVTETQSLTVTVLSTTTDILTSSSSVSITTTESAFTTVSTTIVTTETLTPTALLGVGPEATGYISVNAELGVYLEDTYTAPLDWLLEGEEEQYLYTEGGYEGAKQYLAYSEGDGTLHVWSALEVESLGLVRPVCTQSVDEERNVLLTCQDPTTSTINKFVTCTADDESLYMQLVDTVPSQCSELTSVVVSGVRTRFVARTASGERGYPHADVDYENYNYNNLTLANAMDTDWKIDPDTGEVHGIVNGEKVFWYQPIWSSIVNWYRESDISNTDYKKVLCSVTTNDDTGEQILTCNRDGTPLANVFGHCVEYATRSAEDGGTGEYLGLYVEGSMPAYCEKMDMLLANSIEAI